MEAKIRLGISSCLLGNPVRYDGGHKLDRFLTDTLGRYVEYVPVCPEVECGMSIPRDPCGWRGIRIRLGWSLPAPKLTRPNKCLVGPSGAWLNWRKKGSWIYFQERLSQQRDGTGQGLQ